MKRSNNKTRREFLSVSALGLGGLMLNPKISNASIFADKVRVAIIGTGQRGLELANVLKKVGNAELAAVCDIDPAALQRAAKLAVPNAATYTDYRKLLANRNIDAVIISTPLHLHHPMAVDALQANKHVYVEKTMTYNIDQALDLVKRVKEKPGLVFQVGHQYRNYEMYPRIKTLISEGLIGTVTHYECQYNRNSDWRRPVTDPSLEKQVNWRMYKEFSGGPLAELSAHQIDVVNLLQDSHPVKVVGLGDVNFWKDGRTTFDNIRTIYEYPGGVKSSIVSILSNEFNGYMTRILGSAGSIEMTRDRAFLYPEKKTKEQMIVDGVTGATKEAMMKGEGITIYSDKDKTEPTLFALEDFAKCIKNRKQPVSNVLTGKDTAIAVHMGNKAAESGTLQTWEERFNKI
jgi:predicted dehydrogenase